MTRFRSVALVAALLLAVIQMFAQFNSGLQGNVTDPSGAAIPKVGISLRDVATGVETHATSDDSGNYHFVSLGPSVYELMAKAPGFGNQTAKVTIYTGQVSTFNLKMSVATASTSVTVTTEAPVLDVSDSRLQTTVNTQQLQDLPVAGRNFFNLVAVAPGVTGHGAVGGGAPADAQDNFTTEKDGRRQRKWPQFERQPVHPGWIEHHQQHPARNCQPDAEPGLDSRNDGADEPVQRGARTRQLCASGNDHEIRHQRISRNRFLLFYQSGPVGEIALSDNGLRPI